MQIKGSFGNRRVMISVATSRDLMLYKEQLNALLIPTEERLTIVKNDSAFSYLKVKNSDSKLIGIIQINEIDSTAAVIKFSIPNKSWEMKYGTEVIHQFVKYVIETKAYTRIYFRKNKTTERYKRERPRLFVNNNYYIEIA